MKKCLRCSKQFKVKSKRHPFQRFCSRKCQINYWIKTHPERMKELGRLKRIRTRKQRNRYQKKYYLRKLKENPPSKVPCAFCGKIFIKKPRHKKYCSNSCNGKASYYRHPERHKQKWQEWKQNRPEEYHAHILRRRKRVKNAEGWHTSEEWEKKKKEYNYGCYLCGEKEPIKNQLYKSLTKDHVTSLAKGGTDNIKNIRPACFRCNAQKSDKELNE